jgi:hypothetical protein
MSDELWLPVYEYEDWYEVSSAGNVRSKPRYKKTRWGGEVLMPPRYMSIFIDKNGYKSVGLRKPLSKSKKVEVHRLVALAFLGKPKFNEIVLHGENGRLDNSVNNLKWGTYKQNSLDRVRDGTHNKGEKNINAKLTNRDVLKIKSMTGLNVTIAQKFNVTPERIGQIKNGKGWGHLNAQQE